MNQKRKLFNNEEVDMILKLVKENEKLVSFDIL